jgi:hypothetical protein
MRGRGAGRAREAKGFVLTKIVLAASYDRALDETNAPPGPHSREWAAGGVVLRSRKIEPYSGLTGPFDVVTYLIEWAGGEGLSFVAGWLAYKVARGVRVRIGKTEVTTTSEPDILDILREAQGTKERDGQ